MEITRRYAERRFRNVLACYYRLVCALNAILNASDFLRVHTSINVKRPNVNKIPYTHEYNKTKRQQTAYCS